MQNFDDLFTTPSTPQEDKAAWATRKQQEREALYAQIDEAVSTMASDGPRFQNYLDVQARFDRYSVANAVLIASQMPEATRLGDFDAWKASGAYVKRGAVGLSILEPGKEYQREDGSVGVSYNVKKVFDISQTSAQRPAQKTHPEDRQLLRALLNDPPCKIEVTAEVPDGRKVAYIPDEKNGAILVRQGLDAHTIFRGLAQELSRVHLDRSGHQSASPDFAVYAASYLLCQRNGVPVDSFSFQRMPAAYKEMDPQDLRKELGIIREVAGDVTASMNRFFEVQQRSQKNREPGAR
jgi:hypothetical protein